jgi:uncharacterized protein (DUF4415 family)
MQISLTRNGKATGAGWQTRINSALKKSIAR